MSFFIGAALFLGFFISSSVANAYDAKKLDRRAWTVIREALTTDDSIVREMAVQGLEGVPGSTAKSALLSSLDDESEYVQIWAAKALVQQGDRVGKKQLLAILENSGSSKESLSGPLGALQKMKALARGRMRGEAAEVLGLFTGEPDILAALKNAKKDNDGRVRDGAAIGLALLGDRSETIVFMSAVNDKDAGVRLAAFEALAAIKDPTAASLFQQALSDPSEEIRAVAARGLGALQYKPAAETLRTLILDKNGRVRENAAWALGEIGDPASTNVLRGALNDSNLYVQIVSAEALGKMGNSSGLATIESILNSNDMDARAKAVLALGSFKDTKALALAVKSLDEGNLKVRLGAALAILKEEKH